MVEAYIQIEMKRFQQLMECSFVCFLIGCVDKDLRHPLLECKSVMPSEIVVSTEISGEAALKDLLQEERVRALCDLAAQTGCLQEWSRGIFKPGNRYMRRVIIAPVERPAGILGVLLLADERSEHFDGRENHLFYGRVSTYAEKLERCLRAKNNLTGQHIWEAMSSNVVSEQRGAFSDRIGGSEFVSVIGHELRTPLSIIKGYAGLLQAYGGKGYADEQSLEPDRQQQYLGGIMEQTGLLETLINDLLDCSRIQEGKLALHPGAVDIETLCQRVIQLGQMRADLQAVGKHRLTCKVSEPLPTIWIDKNRLQQVLLNILENAVKYSPEGGSVELEIRPLTFHSIQDSHKFISLTIRDEGIGIPTWYYARLFQPYERLERPEGSPIPGFGLGLYIARILVEAMGGRIDVQSCEGKGTVVTITLPMVAPDTVSIIPEAIEQTKSAGHSYANQGRLGKDRREKSGYLS